METSKALFEKEFVESLLPQKFPIVMVDKMYAFDETSLTSGLEITSENIFVSDGIFLEAGLVEHMAQSVALHTGYQFYIQKETAPTGYIGSIKEVTINQLPKVGDDIKSSVTILQEFAGITLVDIVTTLNESVIATSQMKTILAK